MKMMKTPQQWRDDILARPCITMNDWLVIIKQIQDDAICHAPLPEFIQEALNSGDGTYKP